MKFKIFFFIIAFNFYFVTTSNKLLKRNLEGINKKFLLIGFGDYFDSSFNMHLIKYETKYHYSNIYFNTYVIYQDLNKSDNVPVDCSCEPNCEEQSLTYKCVVKKDEKKDIKNFALNDYQFKAKNLSGVNNLTFNQDQIILSTLAKSTRKNIEKENETLNFNIFYLKDEPIIKKDEVELNGNIKWEDIVESEYFYFNLSIPENVTCHYNYSKNIYERIICQPQNDVNIHLNGMMAKKNYIDNEYILIFENNTDDLILYSKYEDSSFELLGFSDYVPPKTNNDATNRAYFKGTVNNLKKYMRFTAKVINSTTLRFLEESTNVTAYGKIDEYNIDLKNGLVIYDIRYSDTAKYKSIVGMESFHDYEFSDDNETFSKSSAQFIYDKENINLTNAENMAIEFFSFNSSNRFESNAFSFDFSIPPTKQKYNISGKGQAFLNYKYMENSTRYEIGCFVVNKSNLYTISCKPEKDVYTLLKTIRIKIPQVQSTDRLRLLDEDGNSTFYAPQTQSGDIQFDYVPQFNTFARKEKKNTGLSAGAIVAIILSSLAVIAAVGLTIFFLNRKPIKSGPKYINDYNNQNSSININK